MHADEERLIRVTIGVLGAQAGTLALAIRNVTMVLREEFGPLSPAAIETLEVVDEQLLAFEQTTGRFAELFPPDLDALSRPYPEI